ncbi:MAG: hypothetical protein WAL85_05730 [Candidatus Korobacteraceae bacterium]
MLTADQGFQILTQLCSPGRIVFVFDSDDGGYNGQACIDNLSRDGFLLNCSDGRALDFRFELYELQFDSKAPAFLPEYIRAQIPVESRLTEGLWIVFPEGSTMFLAKTR